MGLFDNEEDEILKAPEAQTVQNPSVREYLLKRMADRKALESESKESSTGDTMKAVLGTIGAGFMGKDPTAAGQAILARQDAQKKAKLTDFDSGTDRYVKEQSLLKDDDLFQRESDVGSQESLMANELAQSMGYKGKPLTATQFKSFSPVMAKRYEIEQKKLDRQEARDERRFQQGIKMDEKRIERSTPYGEANTPDDAKKLKEAHEMKKNFDGKIKELISLREKHGGGAILNRDDVGRAKQLSKDLLLAYKDMAKLGVLSVSDENILNEIIPPDPLQYNSPMAAIQGQDPTLHKLKKFQEDSDRDFSTRVSTRTRAGKGATKEKTIAKTQTNQKTGEKRIVYDDGTVEIVNPVAGR